MNYTCEYIVRSVKKDGQPSVAGNYFAWDSSIKEWVNAWYTKKGGWQDTYDGEIINITPEVTHWTFLPADPPVPEGD